MFSGAAFLGVIVIAAAAVLRRILGGRDDQRNVEVLARRHDLDAETATRLYDLARKDGFGSAWGEVVEHPTPVARPQRTAPKPRSRKLGNRHHA